MIELSNKWHSYNHCLVPSTPPHTELKIDSEGLREEMKRQHCLFARWTSQWDCGRETGWWYCIRDEKISLDTLTAKQRYRVKRGLKNVEIRPINKGQYVKELYDVLVKSLADYPEAYRVSIPLDDFKRNLENERGDIYGAFTKEGDVLCGYTIVHPHGNMLNLSLVKVDPAYLSLEVNAAIAYFVCERYLNELGYDYVCDGARNIRHQTNYQHYLVHNLGFRFAYCRLHVMYAPLMKCAVAGLYPMRGIVEKLENKSSLLYNVSCVLKQEAIARSFGGYRYYHLRVPETGVESAALPDGLEVRVVKHSPFSSVHDFLWSVFSGLKRVIEYRIVNKRKNGGGNFYRPGYSAYLDIPVFQERTSCRSLYDRAA